MKIIKDFILREIAGECILVPTGKTSQDFNGMVSLSPSGQFIWENIEKVDSFEEILSLITNEFEIDESIARIQTIEFIAQLLDQGFIQTTKNDKSW